MSKNVDGLSVKKEDVRRCIDRIVKQGCVTSVWLGGSRSPKSPKNSHANSDWDLQLITGTDMRVLPEPTDCDVYVDFFFFSKPSKYAVQLWPVDECGVLN